MSTVPITYMFVVEYMQSVHGVAPFGALPFISFEQDFAGIRDNYKLEKLEYEPIGAIKPENVDVAPTVDPSTIYMLDNNIGALFWGSILDTNLQALTSPDMPLNPGIVNRNLADLIELVFYEDSDRPERIKIKGVYRWVAWSIKLEEVGTNPAKIEFVHNGSGGGDQ